MAKVQSAAQIRKWFFSLPNKLTLARIAAIPVLTVMYPFDFVPSRVVAALLFLAAAFTDLFDGFIARRYDMVTREGALLDPIADKMLIVTGLLLVVAADQLYAFVAILLICRDIAISGLRMIATEQGFEVAVNQVGKFKTAAQIAGLFCLMLSTDLFDIPFRSIGMIIMWIALGSSLVSGYMYWLDFWEKLKNRSLTE